MCLRIPLCGLLNDVFRGQGVGESSLHVSRHLVNVTIYWILFLKILDKKYISISIALHIFVCAA